MGMDHHTSLTDRAVGGLARVCLAVAMLLLVLVAILIVIQVLARNLFSVGLPQIDEAARFAGIAMVYFTTPMLLKMGQHVAVTMLVERLPRLGQRLCLLIGELAMLGFCMFSLYGFYRFLLRAGSFATPAMGMPNLWFYMPAVVGLVVLSVISFYRLYNIAIGREVTE